MPRGLLRCLICVGSDIHCCLFVERQSWRARGRAAGYSDDGKQKGHVMDQEYPPQVQAFLDALACLPGVTSVSASIESLDGLRVEHLSLVDLGHLPHASLRRTNGGLDNEALVQFAFRLEPSAAGWRSLEFLAWVVRDMARSGEIVHLSPFALPPKAGPLIQLGQSLRFHIDLFCQDVGDDLGSVLAMVLRMATFLRFATNLYHSDL